LPGKIRKGTFCESARKIELNSQKFKIQKRIVQQKTMKRKKPHIFPQFYRKAIKGN
jgi:hypothetical protein